MESDAPVILMSVHPYFMWQTPVKGWLKYSLSKIHRLATSTVQIPPLYPCPSTFFLPLYLDVERPLQSAFYYNTEPRKDYSVYVADQLYWSLISVQNISLLNKLLPWLIKITKPWKNPQMQKSIFQPLQKQPAYFTAPIPANTVHVQHYKISQYRFTQTWLLILYYTRLSLI